MALLCVLGGGAWAALSAFAASAPPQPSLTSVPANPTNSTSATFNYSDAQSGVTFACTLNGTAKTCAGTNGSGVTAGSVTLTVPAGPNTFSISALAGGRTSAATSYTWSVDTVAPTVSAPALAAGSPTNASSVAWTVSFSEPVKNVASGNFSLTASNLGGFSITGVSGSGSSYTVTANTGSLTNPSVNGTLALNVANRGSGASTITDLAGNALSTTLPLSGAAFTIDRTPPPAPSITSGPANGSYLGSSSATFGFSDSEAGVSFLCKLDSGLYAACANPVTFTGLADGSHTLTVEAKDAAGNVSGPSGSRSWTVDTTPPPKPTIVGPNNKSSATSATFTISDSDPQATFMCRLDGSAWSACTSPVTYTLLGPGTHVFDAEPIDEVGNVGPYNEWTWTINGLQGTGLPFTVYSTASGLLYPGGPAVRLDLSLSNPNSYTLYITNLTVTLSSVTPAPSQSCTLANYTVSKGFTGSYPIVLAPGANQVPLTSLGYTTAAEPTVSMPDSHTSQDGCKGATLNISYGGSAQS